MGLFSSKSSSTTQNFDHRGAADNGSLVATGDSSIQVTNISQSEDAFDVVEDAISAQRSTTSSAFSYSSDVIQDAFDAVDRSNERADEIARMALGQSKEVTRTALSDAHGTARTAMEQAQARHENDMTEIAKIAVPMGIVVVGLWVWSKST